MFKNNEIWARMAGFTRSTIKKLWGYTLNTAKVVYMLQFIPRLFCLATFSHYDTKCALNENASIFECNQEVFVDNPKEWILYWLVLSILSSFCLYFICGSCRHEQIRKSCRNVSYWLMMILFLLTLGSFVVRFFKTEREDMALCLALFAWWPVTVWQITYLDRLDHVNYTVSRGHSPGESTTSTAVHSYLTKSPGNDSIEPNALWFYIIYKLSLITRCLECFAFASAITLDAVLVLTPAIIHGNIHAALVINMSKIFLYIRVTFVYGICYLYVQKIMHGNRTLFAEPGEPIRV